MHQTGDMMYTSILKKDGSPEKHVNKVQYFSFAHQSPTLTHPFQIERGDSLKTRCYYNNPGVQKPLTFGLGSEQEMCIDFLYYYPYTADMQDHCTFGHGGYFGGTFDGSTALPAGETDPNGWRAFGVNAGTSDEPTCTGGATMEWEKKIPTTPTTPNTCSGDETQYTPAKNGVTETCCLSCKATPDTCVAWVTMVTKGGCAQKCTFTPTQLALDQVKKKCTAAQIKTVSDDYAARKASEPSPGGQGGTVPEPPSTPKCGPNAKVPCVDNGAIVNVFTTSDCTGKSKGFD